jgi:hypothetical protein
MTVERFIDDDPGYLAWNRTHSRGYLLNVSRTPNKNYVVLHKTTCSHISGRPSRGVSWTTDPIKVCAETKEELDEWAMATVGVNASRCGSCTP